MDAEYWLQRWREDQIDFHRDSVMPLLEQHWDALALPAGSHVLVPLAGKSLDMLWLAARGYRVLGVELSSLAVEQFFRENALTPAVHESRYGVHHVAGNIELIAGDVFDLDAQALADCAGVYDRASLIALPPPMRSRYASEFFGALPVGCRALLITVEYPQAERDGPPFSVEEGEVRGLYASRWAVDLLERRELPVERQAFNVSAFDTAVYRLRREG